MSVTRGDVVTPAGRCQGGKYVLHGKASLLFFLLLALLLFRSITICPSISLSVLSATSNQIQMSLTEFRHQMGSGGLLAYLSLKLLFDGIVIRCVLASL